jgi:hypothetical protein
MAWLVRDGATERLGGYKFRKKRDEESCGIPPIPQRARNGWGTQSFGVFWGERPSFVPNRGGRQSRWWAEQ